METRNQDTINRFKQSQKKLFYSVLLVSVLFSAKIIGSFLTNSLALFSDSWHLATDLVSIVISWLGLKITAKAADQKFTFGYFRFSILTALLNNLALIGISIYIFYEAVLRYLNPVP